MAAGRLVPVTVCSWLLSAVCWHGGGLDCDCRLHRSLGLHLSGHGDPLLAEGKLTSSCMLPPLTELHFPVLYEATGHIVECGLGMAEGFQDAHGLQHKREFGQTTP